MKERYMELIEKYKLSIGYKAGTGEEGIIVGTNNMKRGSEDHILIREHKNEILAVLRELKEEKEARQEAERKARQDKEFEEMYPEAVEESRRTGKAVAYKKDMIPCNNPEEECNFDYATFYVRVTPEGFKYTIGNRQHTW